MHRITFYFFYLGINLFRVVPFSLLYIGSWKVYVIIYHLIGYRKKVVIDNLSKCFTKKSQSEIEQIGKAFYKFNLADIFVEGLKGFTMSQKQYRKRYVITNPEILDEYYQNGMDVIALATHYGNWEWGVQAVDGQINHQAVALYKPLSNKFVEKFTKNLREKSGMKLVSIYNTLAFFQSKKEKPVIYIMAADQYPGDQMGKAIWLDFLGRDTPCLHGPESYARYNNIPVVFFNLKRVKRGYYEMEIKKLVEVSKETQPGEITKKYMESLEKAILEKPQDWLWSHKRWKTQRQSM